MGENQVSEFDVNALLNNSLMAEVLKDCYAAGMSPQEAAEYYKAVHLYLSMAVSTFAARMNSLTTWNVANEAYRGMFARQAMAMTWDYAEINPFARHGFMAVVEQMATALEKGTVALGSPDAERIRQEYDARRATWREQWAATVQARHGA